MLWSPTQAGGSLIPGSIGFSTGNMHRVAAHAVGEVLLRCYYILHGRIHGDGIRFRAVDGEDLRAVARGAVVGKSVAHRRRAKSIFGAFVTWSWEGGTTGYNRTTDNVQELRRPIRDDDRRRSIR